MLASSYRFLSGTTTLDRRPRSTPLTIAGCAVAGQLRQHLRQVKFEVRSTLAWRQVEAGTPIWIESVIAAANTAVRVCHGYVTYACCGRRATTPDSRNDAAITFADAVRDGGRLITVSGSTFMSGGHCKAPTRVFVLQRSGLRSHQDHVDLNDRREGPLGRSAARAVTTSALVMMAVNALSAIAQYASGSTRGHREDVPVPDEPSLPINDTKASCQSRCGRGIRGVGRRRAPRRHLCREKPSQALARHPADTCALRPAPGARAPALPESRTVRRVKPMQQAGGVQCLAALNPNSVAEQKPDQQRTSLTQHQVDGPVGGIPRERAAVVVSGRCELCDTNLRSGPARLPAKRVVRAFGVVGYRSRAPSFQSGAENVRRRLQPGRL